MPKRVKNDVEKGIVFRIDFYMVRTSFWMFFLVVFKRNRCTDFELELEAETLNIMIFLGENAHCQENRERGMQNVC